MNYLDPIYKNNSGIVYAIKNIGDDEVSEKIQFQIGDFAMLMTLDDMPNFMKVLNTVEKKYVCENCNSKSHRIVKCETIYATVTIKATKSMLSDLKELVNAVLCNYEINTILQQNGIS